jgi:plastocyanin
MRSFLSFVVLFLFFTSCSKSNSDFNPQGGLLPAKYIYILDSTFYPPTLTVSIGSAINFVNSSSILHTIISDDSITIKTPGIAPATSFYFKKDTIGSFPYHCVNHPTVRGTVIFIP